jgi:ATPase subunit of ABC transporter with duplicated ATPase domains
MSGTLTARGLRVSHGAHLVLDGVDLVVAPGHRIGVVGPNGVGKSTLLRLLAGDQTPDDGSVTRAPTATTVLHLRQEPDVSVAESLFDHLARRTGVAEAQRRLDAVTAQLTAGDAGADDAYGPALENWLALGGADLAERAAIVIAELGLPAELLDRGSEALSGGQRARLQLAAVLLSQADVLLLDEPTNDLDTDGLARLEAFVLGWRGSMVVVSHDREFLERVITSVCEIDEFTRKAVLYEGSWQSYVDERENARRIEWKAYEDFAGKRQGLVDHAQRQREWATTAGRDVGRRGAASESDKHQRHRNQQRAQGLGASAAKADRAVERLDRVAVEEPREPWELRLTIAQAPRSGAIAAELRAAVAARGDVRLGPLDLTVAWADRIRLVGPNGVGKSTLLDALLGRLPLESGDSYVGPGVVIGEIDQSRGLFATAEPVVDIVRAVTGLESEEARTLLAKFRLRGDIALRPSAALSPGERTRAGLALLQARGVNLLVLDEPTNHLDLPAIEQLEQALESYSGTLLLVTHDRRLADAVEVSSTIDVRHLHADRLAH